MLPEICLFLFFTFSFTRIQKKVHKPSDSLIRIPNKVVIVTGAHTGIGFEIARELSRRGGRVILACRNLIKAQKAANKIRSETGYDVVVKHLDLASFKSIHAFVKDIIKSEGRVDILINNACTGVLDNSLTEDNLPIEAQINHFGPFLLTILLVPVMEHLPEPARIINVTSKLHAFGTIDDLDKPGRTLLERRRVHANTKLATILFTKKLAEDVRKDNIIVNCYDPGIVITEMFRDESGVMKLILKPLLLAPKQGAQTAIFLATEEFPLGLYTSGRCYAKCKEKMPSSVALNRVKAQELWYMSLKVCFHTRQWVTAEMPDIGDPSNY